MTEGRTALDRLFAPASVAVVGASERNPAGLRVLRNLAALGFQGRVAAVHPSHSEVAGTPCYSRLSDLPFVPDAVAVTTGAAAAVEVAAEAAQLGVGGIVVPAMGFGEAGPEGAALQDRLAGAAREAGMAVIGPNCQGIVSFASGCGLYLRGLEPYRPGRVAVISQSGSMTTSIVNSRAGLRFRHVASTGNEAVVTAGDLIEHFARDPEVSTILVFAEAIRRPERFAEACDRAFEGGKLVAVLKAGRTERALAAARTHSGAVGSPDRLVDALLRRHHAVRVDSLEELLATGLVADGRRPRGTGLGALTISGGQIALLHDHAERAGVGFPAFAPATTERLEPLLPGFLSASNPLDVWGMQELETRYAQCLGAVADDPAVDAAIAVAEQFQVPTGHPDAHRAYFDAARQVAAASPKPVVLMASVAGGLDPETVESLREAGVTGLAGFDPGLRALGNVGRWSAAPGPPAQPPPLADPGRVAAALAAIAAEGGAGAMALAMLAAAGIPAAAWAPAAGPEQAVAAARSIGHPVALKTADPALLHKTEAGAVEIGLTGDGAVAAAARRIQSRHPGPLIVQAMADGTEMIVGAVNDPELGPFVLVGGGGIWVETLDDVAVRPADLDLGEAAAMIHSLRIAPLLRGARGGSPADVEALAGVVCRLGQVMTRFGGRLASIDLNPVMVSASGALAVDAVVVARG